MSLGCNICNQIIETIGTVRINSALCITCYAKELENRINELEIALNIIKKELDSYK